MANERHYTRALGDPHIENRDLRAIWDLINDVVSMRRTGVQFYLDDDGKLVEMQSRVRFDVNFNRSEDFPDMVKRLEKRNRPSEWVKKLLNKAKNKG